MQTYPGRARAHDIIQAHPLSWEGEASYQGPYGFALGLHCKDVRNAMDIIQVRAFADRVS